MASLLLRPFMRPQILGLGLGLSLASSYHALHQQPARLDSSPFSSDSYKKNAQTPVVRQGGSLNPRAVRQISSGSIIGTSCDFHLTRTNLVAESDALRIMYWVASQYFLEISGFGFGLAGRGRTGNVSKDL